MDRVREIKAEYNASIREIDRDLMKRTVTPTQATTQSFKPRKVTREQTPEVVNLVTEIDHRK